MKKIIPFLAIIVTVYAAYLVWQLSLQNIDKDTARQVQPAVSIVAIKDDKFEPDELKIRSGSEVVFENRGSLKHNIKSQQGLYFSGLMFPGAKFSYIYSSRGSYTYYQLNNPDIRATIIVE